MTQEKELTPNKVIISIADCLNIIGLHEKSPKGNKILILDNLGLSKSTIPETRFKQSPPEFETVYKLITKSMGTNNYCFVRLTLPGMETSSGGLFVSQLLSLDDLVLTDQKKDLVFKAVRSGTEANLLSALKAEVFIRPRSKKLSVNGLDCSLGGGFMVQFDNFIKKAGGELLVRLKIEATLNDTSKRLIGDGKTPQISQVLELPLDKNGIVFPKHSLEPGHEQVTESEVASLIASQVLGLNRHSVSKIFAAMTEIYPRPGGNVISGIYSALPDGTFSGYLTDFDSMDMPLTIAAEKEKSRGGIKIEKPSMKIWEYYTNIEFYEQFRNSPLAGLIHTPRQYNFGYNQMRGGD